MNFQTPLPEIEKPIEIIQRLSLGVLIVFILLAINCNTTNDKNTSVYPKAITTNMLPQINDEDKSKLINEHKRRIAIVLKNIFRNNTDLDPISQINQNDLEETMNAINARVAIDDKPLWISDSWKIVEKLNPRGGWYSKIVTDYYSTNEKILSIENELKEKRKEFTVASRFYLKRQFAENEWELVVMEKNYIGNAVFRGSQNEIQRYRLANRIVTGVVLKNLGREMFKYNSYNAYGPVGSSTEYFYVYELGDYDFKENTNNLNLLKKEIKPQLIELNYAKKKLRSAYHDLIKNYPTLSGD